MAKKSGKTILKRRRVAFSFYGPNADAVFLAGDFNEWNTQKHSMKKNADGLWEKTIYVFPGRYEYKFWADGHWKMDPSNNQACINCYGTENNFVVVSPKPEK